MDFTPNPDRDPSEVVQLRKARRDFLTHKRNTQKASTARAYEYPAKSFVQFCENHGVEVTGDINGYLVERREHGDNFLRFRNRESEGTPLKNGRKSERSITIRDSLAETLGDYISMQRESATDEYGREPLFTVPSGRLYRQRAYKNIVAISRPCVHRGNCLHNRVIEDCEAGRDKEQAPSCPSSVSLHPVRRGSIMNHINRGWPKEKLSERVDVLDKHYDARTEEQARKNRR